MPAMAEVDTALIKCAHVVLVDSHSACAEEAGELITVGVPQAHMVEVGKLLQSTEAPGENSWGWELDVQRVTEVLAAGTGDVTIFKSVGIGVQDVTIAVTMVEWAMEMGISTVVPGFDT